MAPATHPWPGCPKEGPALVPVSEPNHPVELSVRAWGALRVPVAEVAALRKQPGPDPAAPFPPAFLKHADEQTVVGLTAVLQAVEAGGVPGPFTSWVVLAAP